MISEVYREQFIGNLQSGVIMTPQELKEHIENGNMSEFEKALANEYGKVQRCNEILRTQIAEKDKRIDRETLKR